MAIVKVCGLETEYGIVVRGVDSNPVTASSLLINSYLADLSSVGFDVESERPGADARGRELSWEPDPDVDSLLVNAMLTNGARYYVDHAHPEMSIPEVADAREAVVWDAAGDAIVRRSMELANRVLPDGAEVVIHRNNSDGKGNSYGCHENYLVDRAVPFGLVVRGITPHFVTRQIFTGAGKVGSERPGRTTEEVGYQITQRADFFEEPVGLETTVKRPIVNTRDEPHCDPERYRRLHVIVGDANMSEMATFLKVATTAIVLAMIEDGAMPANIELADPVADIRRISHDPSLRATVEMADGRRVRAIDVQWELLAAATTWAQRHGFDAVAGEEVGALALREWEQVLTGLDTDPERVADVVDWVAKRRLIEAYAARHDLRPGSARLRAIDMQYHDLRPQRCLAARAGLRRITTDDEVRAAMTDPPGSTRAYFRGRCLSKFGDAVVAANWDSMVFDVGSGPLRRVPMNEPLRGTESMVGNVIDSSSSAGELLRRIAG